MKTTIKGSSLKLCSCIAFRRDATIKQFLMHHASTGGDDKAQLLRTAVMHYVSTGGDDQMQSFMQYFSNEVDGKVLFLQTAVMHCVPTEGDDRACLPTDLKKRLRTSVQEDVNEVSEQR